jgi:glutaminase
MYDYAGEWLYKIGMPAKSGVAGGVIAVLPGQLGIAVYSPRLDQQGNTVRGIKVCEAISRDLQLHLFSTPPPGKTAIRRRFTGADLRSTRTRSRESVARLKEVRTHLKIYRLQGTLDFPAAEVVMREIMDKRAEISALLLDFKQVLAMNASASRFFEALFDVLFRNNVAIAIVHPGALAEMRRLEASLARHGDRKLRIFDDTDLALEWLETHLLETKATASDSDTALVARKDYELFQGLSPAELEALDRCLVRKKFQQGETIVQAGSAARELFFLARGSVSVVVPLPTGASKRVATFCAGMAFGEMALLDGAPRSATVFADADSECDILGLEEFERLTETQPRIKIIVLRNLCLGVSARLREANRQLSIFE